MADEYPINYNILAEDMASASRVGFTQEDAVWMYEALCKMCNAYDELVDESDNMTTTTGFDPNVTWFPFIKNGMAGFRCKRLDNGQETFIYLNPSTDGDEGGPDVFLYQGPTDEPGDGSPIIFIETFKEVNSGD